MDTHTQPPMTYRRLRRIHAALSNLSARTLPTINSDLKVAATIRTHFQGPHEDSEQKIRKIRESNPIPDGVEGNNIPPAILEQRQREIDDLLDQTVVDFDVAKVTRRITEADLPKALKTGAAEENRGALADILVNLDFLYDLPDEE